MNKSTHIIAIRHGETDWNNSGHYQGQEDIELNAVGRAQAKRIADALVDTPLAAIYTSDLARAHQTASAIAATHTAPLLVDPGLREQHFGVFQGLTGAEIAQRSPEASARWHRREADFGPEGGETRREFSQRCIGAMAKIARKHAGQSIVIVCHGGVLDCLYRAAAGLLLDTPRTWPLDNAAMSHLNYGQEGFSLLEWGNVSHLDKKSQDEVTDFFPAP